MSLKQEILTWAKALELYDAEDYEGALEVFTNIADASKIQTNMGLIYAALGEHELAVERFTEAVGFDQYLAVAYFQCGVSNFLLSRYDLALQDFQDAFLYLRGNGDIKYEQLGLNFRLFAAEVLFNQGLSQIYMDQVEEGLAVLREASTLQANDEHRVIDDAIAERGEGYTVFSIPVGVLFRPSQKKLDNMNTKDYMGKAKLLSSDKEEYKPFVGESSLQVRDATPEQLPIFNPLTRSATTITFKPREEPPKSNISRSQSASAAVVSTFSDATPTTGGAAPIGRNNTVKGPSLPTRGLSIRRANSPAPPAASRASPVDVQTPPQKTQYYENQSRTAPADPKGMPRATQYYDELLDSYADDAPIAGARSDRGQLRSAPSRNNGSRSAPVSSYGGSMRRRPTRKNTVRSRAPSSYEEEEEEGYASGDYDDFAGFELTKIRVKVHYKDDIRGMTLSPETVFDDFMLKLANKFNKSPNQVILQFTDEDGGKVTLADDSDFDLAVETARENAKGKPEGKLEIWCMDR